MKKYVQVGCGMRGIIMYSVPLVKEYADVAKLCGVYDINHKRAELVSEFAESDIPTFDDFDKMLQEVKPDAVIVTPMDSAHDTYIIKSLYAGCDVISEKPLTTTFEKANAILKAKEETGKDVTVTFNLRYHPFFKRIKEIVSSGILGDIYNVNYEWLLDTSHGADYFRRWHRMYKNSGSLMVHKSTHHFDIANWLLDQDPVEVNAYGQLLFYGPVKKERGERCLTCKYKDTCKFFFDIKEDPYNKYYLDCEDVDGYIRDKCIFSDEIDIHDTVNLTVCYSGGTVMNYSLTAHSPYEGLHLVLNGSLGRLEINKILGHKPNFNSEKDDYIKFYNRNDEEIFIEAESDSSGGHGGADPKIRDSLFRNVTEDDIGQKADLRAGLMSIGIGMAANVSMAENRKVRLSEFYDDLKKYE